jgi:hypothetical protein
MGRVVLQPGSFTIKITAGKIQDGELFRLRNLVLTPQ